MINEKQIESLMKKIKKYDNILIYRHSGPDGDALGSQFGLKSVLVSLFPNKKIVVVGDEKRDSKIFDFFPSFDKIDPDLLEEKFLGIVLDTANVERINHESYRKADFLIKVDHHPDKDDYSDLSIVYPEAASTTELIMSIIEKFIDIEIPKKAFKYFLIGMITDTNRFQYSSTTSNTLRQASKCYEYVEFDVLYEKLYKKKIEDFRTSSKIFQMAKFEGNVAIVIIPKWFSKKHKYVRGVKKLFVNELLLPYEIEYLLFASYDFQKKSWKGSLRSKRLPINDIAEKYNGGGHPKASGFLVENKREVNKMAKDLLELSKTGNFIADEK